MARTTEKATQALYVRYVVVIETYHTSTVEGLVAMVNPVTNCDYDIVNEAVVIVVVAEKHYYLRNKWRASERE